MEICEIQRIQTDWFDHHRKILGVEAVLLEVSVLDASNAMTMSAITSLCVCSLLLQRACGLCRQIPSAV